MNKKILIFLFSAVFLKQILWVALVPLWHFPDEQAHFAQAAFLAEKGSQPIQDDYDLTEEIRISENLLGTERDKSGNNRFTFHPEYRLDYSNTFTGHHEQEIQNLSGIKNLRSMSKHEASRYPPLYYFFVALPYKIFYFNDLFIRVFTARAVQSVFFLGTVYFAWSIARMIFAQNYLLINSLTLLVAFHPMLSFVSAGINSDSLGTFLFSLFLFSSLKIIKNKLTIKKIVEIILVSLLAIYAKPQFFITIPLIFLIILYKFFLDSQFTQNKLKLAVIFTLFLSLLIIFLMQTGSPIVHLLRNTILSVSSFDYFLNLKTYALPHLYREVLPWYWGVFDWLGVTYPRIVHRTVNWLLLASVVGFVAYLIRNFKKLFLWPQVGFIYLIIVNFFYFTGVYLFDWIQFVASGYKFHLGVQGRYFFPLIISHMLFILVGWQELFRFFPKLFKLTAKLLTLFMFSFHWYALFLVTAIYYDLSSFSVFIRQASQYKPWFFKGGFLVILIIAALTLNLVYLIKYLKYEEFYEKDSISK